MKQKFVTVFPTTQDWKEHNDWPPKRANDFQIWLRDIICRIPDEYLPNSVIELDVVGLSDDDPRVEISVGYEMPMIEEEESLLKANEIKRIQSDIEYHKEEIAKLEKKL